MKTRDALILPSCGLGDGLLMMIASFYLSKQGFKVSVYHDKLYELAPLFPYCSIYKKEAPFETIVGTFKEPPYTFLQHSNCPKDNHFIKNFGGPLSVLYGEHRLGKHLPLKPLDRVLPATQTMASSLNSAMMSLLKAPNLHKNNGLTLQALPKEPRHILIHPTSMDSARNYPPEKFLWLAQALLKQGMKVSFCMHESEKAWWEDKLPNGALLPSLPSLTDTARLISSGALLIGNDSGIAHLASNLGLKTLIFSKSKRHIRRWRPDFVPSLALTPPAWVPNFKPYRLRHTYWHHFIPRSFVLKTALNLLRCP